MPGSMKRTRSSSQQHDTENDPPTPSTPTSTRPTHRRGLSTATPPTPELTTPTRPILTRSATMAAPPTPLTRSNSLLSPMTRRSNLNMDHGHGTMGAPTTPSRGGMLLRTQSTPSIASPSFAQLKDLAGSGAGTPGTPGTEKGENEGFGFGRGGRRWGRGKENVPPKKEDEDDQGNARKRSRVGSFSSRARSGSVSSMASIRSESRMPSVAPSSASFGRRASRVSPSPSLSSATSYSFESTTTASSSATFESDIDATPTKRPLPNRRARTLPTLPPTSPRFTAELDTAAQRFGLVRVQSDITESEVCYDTEVDEEVPLRKKNPYKVLKSFLRLSGDQAIVGREEEKAGLMGYLQKGNEEDVGVYVSGPPGTGKTATVMGIGRELRKEGWKVVELGCMGMKVGDVWKCLGEALGCGKTEEGVRVYLSTAGKTLLVLDEIDSLLPPPPTVAPPTTSHLLSKLFTLPFNTTTKLISISNTLDLTVRARLTLPPNTQPIILPFRAYSGMDMTPIITSRIDTAGPLAAKVDLKAIELLTRKIEASNGDLRTCLGVLTAAITLAENEWLKKVAQAGDEGDVPLVKVVMTHTIKAFSNHTSTLKASAGSSSTGTSPTTKKVQSVQLQGKMVLVSILVFLARARAGLPGCPTTTSPVHTPVSTPTRGVEQLTTGNLYATYVCLMSHHASPFPPASESDYRDLVGGLEVLGLVGGGGFGGMMSRSGSGMGLGRRSGGVGAVGRVELLVREEEVAQGLGLGAAGAGSGKGLAEEEVGKIWEREEGRIKRGKEKMLKSKDVDVEMGF